jgi:hypothetical protein
LGQAVTQFVPALHGVDHWYRLVGLTPFATYRAIWTSIGEATGFLGLPQAMQRSHLHRGSANDCQEFQIGDTDTIELNVLAAASFEGFQYTFTILEGEC